LDSVGRREGNREGQQNQKKVKSFHSFTSLGEVIPANQMHMKCHRLKSAIKNLNVLF
jgi:hypothetical protein